MIRSRVLQRLTPEQAAPMAVATLAVFEMSLLWMYDPATSRLFPPCPFHAVTGYLCPGCGTLRALHQLLQGHLASAFRLNPMMVVSLPFVGYSGLASAIDSVPPGGHCLAHSSRLDISGCCLPPSCCSGSSEILAFAPPLES